MSENSAYPPFYMAVAALVIKHGYSIKFDRAYNDKGEIDNSHIKFHALKETEDGLLIDIHRDLGIMTFNNTHELVVVMDRLTAIYNETVKKRRNTDPSTCEHSLTLTNKDNKTYKVCVNCMYREEANDIKPVGVIESSKGPVQMVKLNLN